LEARRKDAVQRAGGRLLKALHADVGRHEAVRTTRGRPLTSSLLQRGSKADAATAKQARRTADSISVNPLVTRESRCPACWFSAPVDLLFNPFPLL